MFPFQLTTAQRKQIEQARTNGEARVVLKLTKQQRESELRHLNEIEQAIESERDTTNLSRQLRMARKDAGLTLEQVAELAGMTKQAVLRIESGKNANPKLETLERLSKALGKSLRVEVVDAK